VTTRVCRDTRCTDGVTWCVPCHGHGVVNPKGKRYRIACKQLPAWAVPCEACHGTGMAACGCTPLDVAMAAVLLGQRVSDALSARAGVSQ
jgi:hypothetical protein